MSVTTPGLSVEIAGLRLKNPCHDRLGTFGWGTEYGDLVDLPRLGAVVVKATTLAPRAGNDPPRVIETSAGMLNAIGLQNPGVDAVIAEKLPALADCGAPVIVNIAGETLGDYVEVARRLGESPVSAPWRSTPLSEHRAWRHAVRPAARGPGGAGRRRARDHAPPPSSRSCRRT